jgi:hypothetical protein
MKKLYELGTQHPFDCGDGEPKGNLVRRGKELWLEPIKNDILQIYLNEDKDPTTKNTKIPENYFTLTLKSKDRSSEKKFVIEITK